MEKLQINTGAKKYEIEDENGNLLGIIIIHPNDFNLGKRVKEAEKNILELIKEAEQIANSNNVTNEDIVNDIAELDKKIKAELDIMLNGNVTETIFKGLNCLNINNGKYFIEIFLEMIVPVITKELEASVKASNDRIDKYTSQVVTK